MARGKGKGQKLDHLWRKFGDISERVVSGLAESEDLFNLYEIYQQVKVFEPISDYEIKDKDNLLSQLKDTTKRWHDNDKAIQEEYERQFRPLLERI